MELRNKVVLITGASSGIGEATAKALAKEGAAVILAARSAEKLNRVVSQIGMKNVLSVPTDLTNKKDIDSLISQTITNFKRIDILVNNAGVGMNAPFETMTIENFKKLLEINVFAPVMLTQAIVPFMRKAGGGKIINISSMITRIVTFGSSGYRASKVALNALSDSARYELKKDNIQVITVLPGLTATNFYSNSIGAITDNESTIKNPSGRAPELVAKKIITAIQKNHREVYMSFRSFLRGKFAQLFPNLTESLMVYRKKKS